MCEWEVELFPRQYSLVACTMSAHAWSAMWLWNCSEERRESKWGRERQSEREKRLWWSDGVVESVLGGPQSDTSGTTQHAHKNRIDSRREINHVKLKSRGLSGTYISHTKHYQVTVAETLVVMVFIIDETFCVFAWWVKMWGRTRPDWFLHQDISSSRN